MGAPRRKTIIASRRRVEDEGEEEADSLEAGLDDDSLSEGSAISEVDDDADAEGSEASDTESVDRRHIKSKASANGHPGGSIDAEHQPIRPSKKQLLSSKMRDTDAMMNGLHISGDVEEGEEMRFDEIGKTSPRETPQKASTQDPTVFTSSDNLGEKRRREHEEYKKKRDEDPAFVPNRGGFFMHDHRSAAPGQNGYRLYGRGRGRGRGAMGGSSSATR